MAKDSITKSHRNITISYVFMFFTLFTIVFGLFAYLFARKVSVTTDVEVWLQTHSFWVMRNIFIYLFLSLFASLWFIPLYFYYWDTYMWVTACTVIGVVFAIIAFLFLLNAWLKGMSKFFKNKAVF